MAEEATKVPSELVMSAKWDKLLERVLINVRDPRPRGGREIHFPRGRAPPRPPPVAERSRRRPPRRPGSA